MKTLTEEPPILTTWLRLYITSGKQVNRNMECYHFNFRNDQYTINMKINVQLKEISKEFATMDRRIEHIYFDLEFQTIGKSFATNMNIDLLIFSG